MRCPNCDSENSDSAKFCKKCGTSLKKSAINHESMINSMNSKSKGDNTTKYIIVALVIIAIVLAGAFVYIYGFGSNNNDSQTQPAQQAKNNQTAQQDDEPAQTQAQSVQSTPESSSMSILGGSFETGGGLEDKTYASIFVGPEHSGEKVTIQILYSRDGNALNNGNMVPKTVDSSGYINVRSSDAYKYFPDYAEINLYDNSGNLMDTQGVNLNPSSGTQTF